MILLKCTLIKEESDVNIKEENQYLEDSDFSYNNQEVCLESDILYRKGKKMVEQPKIRIFVCNICGKTFSKNNSLASHMNIHNVVDSLRCKVCGENFDRKRDMVIHMR